MIKDWKIWEKMRRNIEKSPKEYDDMQYVVGVYYAYILGMIFFGLSFILFIDSAALMAIGKVFYAISAFMLSCGCFIVGYIYASVIDLYKKNRKYAPEGNQYIHGYTRAKRGEKP